jgi:hypothetical protein
MSRHDVAVLTLRAFALYAWFQALEFFASGAMAAILSTSLQLEGGLTFGTAVASFGPSLLFIGVGAFLFVRSRELASWLLPLPSDAEQLPPHPLPAASVAFAVIGVAIFLHAVQPALAYAITFADIDDTKARAQRFGIEAPHVIGVAAQLALGFFLFLRARTFATAWWRKQQPKPRE